MLAEWTTYRYLKLSAYSTVDEYVHVQRRICILVMIVGHCHGIYNLFA